MNTVLVRVAVLPLESNRWRLVEATPDGEGLLRIQGTVLPGEDWQFRPGEYVEYDERTLEDGSSALVAVRSAIPEYRKNRVTHAVVGLVLGPFIGLYFMRVFHIALVFGSWAFLASIVMGAVGMGVSSYLWGDRAWTFVSENVRGWRQLFY